MTEGIFLFSSFRYIFESENFRFSFSSKNSPTWGVKCEKLKFRKNVGDLLDKLRKLYMNGIDYPEIFSRPKPIENSRPCLVFQTDMFYRKQLFGFPVC